MTLAVFRRLSRYGSRSVVNSHLSGRSRSQTTYIEDTDGERRSMFYYDSDPLGVTNPGIPPLLLLPGTCQTVSTWQPHIKELSQNRRLLIPEFRCCGTKTELLPVINSLYDFTTDLEKFLHEIQAPVVDVAGFSFGGRVALSLAAYKPELVRRLSVTGVPLQRPPLGSLVLQSWQSGLTSDVSFLSTAWAFVLNGFSEDYLKRNSRNIAHYVERVYQNNHFQNLRVLLSQSHSPDDKAAAINCVHLINCPTQVIAATADRISDIDEEKRLADAIRNCSFHHITGSGHLSPFEQPELWRNQLLSFLDEADR